MSKPYKITKDTLVSNAVLDEIARIPTEHLPEQVDPEFFKKLEDKDFMRIAVLLAQKGYDEGGCPIGGVIIDNKTKMIIGKGHNTMMQENNSIVHGETAATIDAGKVAQIQEKGLVNFAGTTMFTTLTPCRVCCAQLVTRTRPDRVVIGDVTNAPSSAAKIEIGGIQVDILEDPKGVELYKRYSEEFPEKHYSDWLGARWYQENKHRPANELRDAAIQEAQRLDAADAHVFLTGSGEKSFTGDERARGAAPGVRGPVAGAG